MRNRIYHIARKLTVAAIISGLTAWLPLSAFHERGSASAQTANRGASAELPALQGEQAVQQLKEQGLYDSLEDAVAAARYEMRWEEQPTLRQLAPSYHAPNPAQGMSGYFTSEGLHLVSKRARSEADGNNGALEGAEWQAEMKLIGYGYGKNLMLAGPAELVAEQNRIEYRRKGLPLAEWYINKAEGLEQGFTVESRPGAKAERERLKVVLGVSGDLRAELAEEGRAIALKQEGEAVLRYGELHCYDAEGRVLPSEMKVSEGRVVLEVEEEGAVYPVTIDPLFSQQAKLIASDGAGDDHFGASVAISDDTVVVGAPGDEIGSNASQGSAYVFIRKDGKTWSQQKLTASDGAAHDHFGFSVANSGNTVVVGAYRHDDNRGSAYVFVRSGTTWTEQKLTASDAAAGHHFGFSVAINGNTVVVGARGHNVSRGSAYVFVRSGTTWNEQQKLTASDGRVGDYFGSVAISGDTVVVGAFGDDMGSFPSVTWGQGSAYVFLRSGTTWSEQQKLTASDGETGDYFGGSVAISEDKVVVGASGDDTGSNVDQGSAYVFLRSGTTWSEQQKLTASDGAADDRFGISVDISGASIVVGAERDAIGSNVGQGSAFVFLQSGTTWSEHQKLLANDGAAGDEFGISVAISLNVVVVGAKADDTGSNVADQGSVYMFSIWSQQQKLTASDAATFDSFGYSVAIDKSIAVVGAPYDDIGSNVDQGSAYVFVRSGSNWLQRKLTASDGAAGDYFGSSVAIGGATIVVGAPYDNIGSNSAQGSAYVFVLSGATWIEQQKLTAGDGAGNDLFGDSVAISGETFVVGAWRDDIGSNVDQGSAYVFVRSGVTWSEQQKLIAGDGGRHDEFGYSVAISDRTVVVGSVYDNIGSNVDQGSAYVFERSGTTWTEQQKLTASDGAAADWFGLSVAISGDTVVVGAPNNDIGSNSSQGSAYVFVRSDKSWSQQQKLTASGGAAEDYFGQSVAISGDTVVVGVWGDDAGSSVDQGSAYLFVLRGSAWSEQQKLTAADGAGGDGFGLSVAISKNVVVVGARWDDFGTNSDRGSAYVFVGP